VAVLRAAREAGRLPQADFVAGHSLGEFSALVAAGSLDFPEALRLVRERGRLMGEAGRRAPGRMLAVLGLPDEAVEEAVRRHPGAQVANYNAPGQVVVSGEAAAVEALAGDLAASGAMRLVPLPITIAAHSALMEPAARAFREVVAQAAWRDAELPVVVNRSAEPLTSAAALQDAVAQQLTSPVRWTQSVERLLAAGVSRFYEVGPGSVLSGLVRRIARGRPGVELQVASLAEPVAP
jgi:[acyl-carrier-protein] S-malonyltransferase